MKTVLIKEKLHHYIETAGENKLKAIYTMVEDDIKEPANHWANPAFVAKLEQREKGYKNGTAIMLSLDESVKNARKAIKRTKTAR
jgi:hypothetical protein